MNIKPMSNLYKTETVLDEASGSIIIYVPVVVDETLGLLVPDNVRQTFFKGQVYVNSQPVLFNIPALTLSEAIETWEVTVRKVLYDIQDSMKTKAMAESRLLVPGRRQ